MAKRKKFYYVLVLTDEGAKFVTNVDRKTKTALFDGTKAPFEFERKEIAEDMALGLTANFHLAYAVSLPYELEMQPYNYKGGHFEWVENKPEEEVEEKTEK